MEACASAHYWAREIQALGHEVRLIPPQYVRPFVKTNKNDAADAEAICEAVTRPTMRFAPAKSAEQQSVSCLSMKSSSDERSVWDGLGSVGAVNEARDHGVELVAPVVSPGEAGEVALGMIGAELAVGSGDLAA